MKNASKRIRLSEIEIGKSFCYHQMYCVYRTKSTNICMFVTKPHVTTVWNMRRRLCKIPSTTPLPYITQRKSSSMKWIKDSWQLKQIYSSKYISWFSTTSSVEQLVLNVQTLFIILCSGLSIRRNNKIKWRKCQIARANLSKTTSCIPSRL